MKEKKIPRKKKKLTIGRTDTLDFPELHLFNIGTKIDTGAFSSSIHCHNIELVEKEGKTLLKFNLLDPSHQEYNEKEFLITDFHQKIVKSSFGDEELRYIFDTQVTLFGKTITTEFSLADRTKMKYAVLLGRKLLYSGRFIVDVAKRNLSYKRKLRKLNQSTDENSSIIKG